MEEDDAAIRLDKLQYQLHCVYEVCKLQNILNIQSSESETSENPKIESQRIVKMMDEFIKIYPLITKNLLAKNANNSSEQTRTCQETRLQKIVPDQSHDLLQNHSPATKSGEGGVSELQTVINGINHDENIQMRNAPGFQKSGFAKPTSITYRSNRASKSVQKVLNGKVNKSVSQQTHANLHG